MSEISRTQVRRGSGRVDGSFAFGPGWPSDMVIQALDSEPEVAVLVHRAHGAMISHRFDA